MAHSLVKTSSAKAPAGPSAEPAPAPLPGEGAEVTACGVRHTESAPMYGSPKANCLDTLAFRYQLANCRWVCGGGSVQVQRLRLGEPPVWTPAGLEDWGRRAEWIRKGGGWGR